MKYSFFRCLSPKKTTSFFFKKALLCLSLFFYSLCFYILSGGGTSYARSLHNRNNKVQHKQSILLEADTFERLPDNIIIAKGHVKVFNKNRYLFADMVSIDQKTKIITAAGHVKLYTKDHHVFFASYLKTDPSLSSFIAKKLGVQTPDDITIVSHKTKITPHKQQYQKALYTKCEIKKDSHPLWCVSASSIEHDSVKKKYYFYNLLLKAYGVPVFYIPFMSKYDNTVKRKRGLLDIHNGFSERLGSFATIPYFIPIGKSKNLILQPLISQKLGIIPDITYNQDFNRGSFSAQVAYIYDTSKYNDKNTTQRYYTNLQGSYDLSSHFRINAHLNRSSDKSFIAQFPEVTGEPTNLNYLSSQFQVEGFWDKTYIESHALSLQNLQVGKSNTDTFIIPEVSLIHNTSKDLLGGHFSFTGQTHMTQEKYYPDQQTLNLQQRYTLPYIWKGLETTFKTFFQEDVFHTSSLRKQNAYDGMEHRELTNNRIYQRTGILARYPFINTKYPLIITPFIGYFTSFAGKNDIRLINDNTPYPIFDENSLFSLNRFSGSNIFDTSKRFLYGTTLSYAPTPSSKASLLIAQNNILSNPDVSQAFFGDKKSNNYYTSFSLTPFSGLNLKNSTVFDHKSAKVLFNQSSLSISTPWITWSNQYILLDKLIKNAPYTNSLSTSATLNVIPHISLSLSDIRSLAHNSFKNISNNVSVKYENDCLILQGVISRSNISTTYIKPSTSYYLTITLKSLTSFSFKPKT